jgi:aminopeptidase
MNHTEEAVRERCALALERIRQIPGEIADSQVTAPQFLGYFDRTARFLSLFGEEQQFLAAGGQQTASLPELKARNRALYEDILPENYAKSWCNPVYAVRQLGKEYGQLFSALSYEMRSAIPYIYADAPDHAVIRFELFLEIYGAFTCAMREASAAPRTGDASGSPQAGGGSAVPPVFEIRQKMASYLSDYAVFEDTYSIREMLIGSNEKAVVRLIRQGDLSDLRYLYSYGEYVGENEILSAQHLLSLPEEEIAKMADTYTEGFRIGFINTGKDLSKNRYYSVYYHLGFERMMRRAFANFDAMGLLPTTFSDIPTLFRLLHSWKNGYAGADANPQYLYDHRQDLALFLDRPFQENMLKSMAKAYDSMHGDTELYAGPAVLEVFGDLPFSPAAKEDAVRFDEKQQEMIAAYNSKAASLYAKAVIAENRSFTIIDFPLPSIAVKTDADGCFDLKKYREIFEAVVAINTLDYQTYQRIQQTLIDTLNLAEQVHVRGMNGNRTDLTVRLYTLTDPAHQTIFENCVADVNIPVGEVFTSPVLEGTNGLLQVSEVFLEGLKFTDLFLRFEDGRVADYGCGNFADPEEGRKYIEENILFHHKRLPMGEFAIGTNTTAYRAARRFGIADRLPILIAEKTGPHFAVGDTCYSEEEDNRTFNPDGKEIVAKENTVSGQRKTDPEKAYFGCHTDITIPYEELGLLEAVLPDGTRIPLLEDGRFVLPGTEELNAPLDEA